MRKETKSSFYNKYYQRQFSLDQHLPKIAYDRRDRNIVCSNKISNGDNIEDRYARNKPDQSGTRTVGLSNFADDHSIAFATSWIEGDDYESFFQKHEINEVNQDLIRAAIEKESQTYRKLIEEGMVGSNADMQNRSEHLNRLALKFEEDLKPALGSEAFDALVYYRDTWAARDFTNTIADRMEGAGYALTTEVLAELIRIFKNNAAVLSTAYLRTFPSIANSEAKRFAQTQEAVMKDADNVLNSEQMEVLKEFWLNLMNENDEKTEPIIE
jgi:hypothetical protein